MITEDQTHLRGAGAVHVDIVLRVDRGRTLQATGHVLGAVAPQRGQTLGFALGLGLGLDLVELRGHPLRRGAVGEIHHQHLGLRLGQRPVLFADRIVERGGALLRFGLARGGLRGGGGLHRLGIFAAAGEQRGAEREGRHPESERTDRVVHAFSWERFDEVGSDHIDRIMTIGS
jgi:hypothetical protein